MFVGYHSDLYDCDKEFLWQLGPHADEIHIVRKMMRNKYGKNYVCLSMEHSL